MPTTSTTNTNLDLEKLFDRPVVVTPLDGAPAPDAVVFWNANNEGFCVQPLHTAADRKLLARRMEALRRGMSGEGTHE